jgi:hypothetical protein
MKTSSKISEDYKRNQGWKVSPGEHQRQNSDYQVGSTVYHKDGKIKAVTRIGWYPKRNTAESKQRLIKSLSDPNHEHHARYKPFDGVDIHLDKHPDTFNIGDKR